MKLSIGMLLATLCFFPAAPAMAQGAGMALELAQGNWLAMHHTVDGGITTDVCIAAAADGGLGLRVDGNDIELRFTDEKWNLPVNTAGDVTISAGAYSGTFKTVSDGPKMLVGVTNQENLGALIRAFNTATMAQVKFGSKSARTISLSGSTRVLAEFRGCVQQAGLADLGPIAGPSNSPF